jgi:ribokinase
MRLFVAANFVMASCWKLARIPALGETLSATDFSEEPGGKGLNVAVGVRRLGHHVDALLGIGRDVAGSALLDLLAREGIDTQYVNEFAANSGHGAGLITADGDNVIAVYPGANLLLDESHADLAASAICQSDCVYGQFETSLTAVQRCFELAREQGVYTVLNPSPWQPVPASLLAQTQMLLVNEVEAVALLGLSDPLPPGLIEATMHLETVMDGFRAHWDGLLIVTLGATGCVAFRPEHAPIAVPGFIVDAIDTVGAGDAFAAGLLTRLDGKTSLEDALRYACACGAIMASSRGVLDALPDCGEVERFLETAISTTIGSGTGRLRQGCRAPHYPLLDERSEIAETVGEFHEDYNPVPSGQ